MKLQNVQQNQTGKTGVVAFRRLFLFSALLLLPLQAYAYTSFRQGSKHDFVDNRYTGGGVCSECHATWEPRPAPDPGCQNTGQCRDTCHSATPSLPAGGDWSDVTGVTPPKTPHAGVVGRCEKCHNANTEIFKCLDCHRTGGVDAIMCRTTEDYDSGSAANPIQSEVAKFFSGIADYSPMSGLLSSHNIIYNKDGSLNTVTDNECLKCHGASAALTHPGVKAGSPVLQFPDDPDGAGPLTINGSIIRPQTSDEQEWNDYYLARRQTFCLACHDGEVNEPGAQITLGGQSVPAVPPGFKFDLTAGNDVTSETPYFANNDESNFAANNFFEGNGHGRSVDRRSIPMNLTCLGEEPRPGDVDVSGTSGAVGTGCHSVHGSKNYSLIRDAASDGSVNLGTGVNTAAEMATQVCLGCHSRSVMRTYRDYSGGGAGVEINTGFHVGWGSGYRMSHFDGFCDNVTAGNMNDNTLNNGGVHWRALPAGNSMSTGVPPASAEVLPVFSSKTDDLKLGRTYTRSFDSDNCDQSASSSGSAINCLTCHDPHGTANVYQEGERGPPQVFGTKGMTRRPLTDTGVYADPVDPLCGQCHID